MFAVILIILALAGGIAGTYYLMDGPRRRALERLVALKRDQRDLDDDRERFEETSRRLEERRRQLTASVVEYDRRVAELANRETEFGRRVIAYDELAAENRILRADLRNAVVHAAYLERLQHENRSGA